MDHRAKLLTKIFRQGFRTPDWRHNEPPPVVTLGDFFIGNTDRDSFAVNLGDEHPGLSFFHDRLRAIESRDDVACVLVNIYDLSRIVMGEEDAWPYAENVHILTKAPEAVVQEWADELLSDGAGEGPQTRPRGYRWWSLYWD